MRRFPDAEQVNGLWIQPKTPGKEVSRVYRTKPGMHVRNIFTVELYW
jgi:hypothetical protein